MGRLSVLGLICGAVLAAVGKWRYQPIDTAQTTEVEMVFSGE